MPHLIGKIDATVDATAAIVETTKTNTDKTRLSYWFPKLEAAGLPVPRTVLVTAGADELLDLYKSVLDGEEENSCTAFLRRLKNAADGMGYPCFLRTDHTSAKHEWENTCYLTNGEEIFDHVAAIINYWECVQMIAPDCDVWAVREFLPTMPLGVCMRYGNMPVCREFRVFVKDGEIICSHPYWPSEALEDGGAEYYKGLSYERFIEMDPQIFPIAVEAGKVLGGAWSMDFLETKKGWMLTDLAEAEKSWHWPGCPKEDG